MGKANVKIDSWEPLEEHEFVYPKGKESSEVLKKINEDLTPELIKAFKDGLGDSLPELKQLDAERKRRKIP